MVQLGVLPSPAETGLVHGHRHRVTARAIALPRPGAAARRWPVLASAGLALGISLGLWAALYLGVAWLLA